MPLRVPLPLPPVLELERERTLEGETNGERCDGRRLLVLVVEVDRLALACFSPLLLFSFTFLPTPLPRARVLCLRLRPRLPATAS